jgi:tRNA nucleotidyltransferase/poly(A) polymerase
MATKDFAPDKIIQDLPLYKMAKKVCALLQQAGHEAYLVGGCVRDFLLFPQRKPKDLDITTSAAPRAVKNVFPKTTFAGEAFGVSLVPQGGFHFEVATFRTEGASLNRRHPDWVKLGGTLKTDSERRDFTINSFYYDPVSQQLHAPQSDALNDLEQKILRCVGAPHARFQEDALRIVRLCRFAATLDFSIDPATEIAAKNNAQLVTTLPQERFITECVKVKDSGLFLSFLHNLNLLPHLFVGLPESSFELLGGMNFKKLSQTRSEHRLGFFRLWAFLALAVVKAQTPQAHKVLMEELEPWTIPRQEKRQCQFLVKLLCFEQEGCGPKPLLTSAWPLRINRPHQQRLSLEELTAQGFLWFLEAQHLEATAHPGDLKCILKYTIYGLRQLGISQGVEVLQDFQQGKFPIVPHQRREELRKTMEEKGIPNNVTANVFSLERFLGRRSQPQPRPQTKQSGQLENH